MDFAEALRTAMNGMSQQKLAELSGVPQNTLSRYLRGITAPKVTRLAALEAALPALRELLHQDKVA